MITPAYSPTATERVLPRLALDFTTASLDPRVTVTRALNTATRVNSSGFIETVNADLPRFDYDPTTLACKGLLIEETRTNYCLQSVFANGGNVPSGWTLVLGTSGVSSASTILGTASGAYTFTAAGNRQIIAQGAITAAANTTYTITVYVEANPDNNLASQMLSIVGNPAGSTVTAPTGTPTAGTRIRATLVVGATAGTFDLRLGIGVTGNATGTVRLSAPQIEIGTFPTSYIPTTTTSLTRNADQVTMTGTNFSSWYNASEGTLSFEGSIFVDQGATTVDFIQMSNGVSNSISIDLAMFGANAPVFQVSNSGTQCSIDTGTLTLNTVFKMVGAYKENAFVAAMNGQSPGVDNSGTIPSGLVQMGIGNRLSGPLMNGHARKIAYWPQRLINAETQAFSKG